MEMERITAELHLKTGLKSRLPPVTQFHFHLGQYVRFYREKLKRWERPFNISRIDGKQIWDTYVDNSKPLKFPQVLPCAANVADR